MKYKFLPYKLIGDAAQCDHMVIISIQIWI
jgi:hypothetical protein